MPEITTQSLIKEARAFHLKKRLGQHFLVDPDALNALVDALEIGPGDTVIEVGPGIGFLTRQLDARGARVVAVELDREGVENLRSAGFKNTEIMHGDILRFDLNTFEFYHRKNDRPNASERPSYRLKVAGNVPYQITGLIVGHLLGDLDKPSPWIDRIDSVALTVQYEVAQRMVARAGEKEYSRLSLLVQQYCHAELIMEVPADRFFPPPRVDSAVVKLTPLPSPAVTCQNMTLARHLAEAGFRQRRKMFRNALGFLKLPPAEIDNVFAALELDPQVRAERLSLTQFAKLADAFLEKGVNVKNASAGASQDQSDL